MANLKTVGLVIRQTDYGESNRLLSIFTRDYGIVKASAYGARNIRSKYSAASQFLCYSEFNLYKGAGDIMRISEAVPIEIFSPLQEDIAKLALAAYICELTYFVSDAAAGEDGLLPLLLNTLYACAYKGIEIDVAKPVFELRAMAYGGYMPHLSACVCCGKKDGFSAFSVKNGGAVCEECRKSTDFAMDKAVYSAMRYILSCDGRRLFSFEISPGVCRELGEIAEEYVRVYLERDFKSLDYLKKFMS